MARALRENDVTARLKAACKAAGGQAIWARGAGLSRSYVTQVLSGRCAPGDAILLPLGLQRDVRYVERAPETVELLGESGEVLVRAERVDRRAVARKSAATRMARARAAA